MNARLSWILLPCLFLGGFAIREVVRTARESGPRVELGRVKLTRLSPAMEQRLRTLKDDVFLTYYVSPANEMPSHMRGVEASVVSLLSAIREHSAGRVEYHVVDPTGSEDNRRFAGRRKVAPVRIRSVTHDSYSEQELYSTLTITYGPRPAVMIAGIGPEHLPRLQSLLIAHLDQLDAPRSPVFALAAPSQGYNELRAFLGGAGRLIDVDMTAGGDLPEEADVFFWIAPEAVDDSRLRSLRHFVTSGRSVVIAAQEHRAVVDTARGAVSLAATGYDAKAMLGAFGLAPVEGLLIDQKSSPIPLPTGEASAPFRISCLALNQDFQSMAKEPRGSLLFIAPTAVSMQAERMAELGYRAEILATTSDETSVVENLGEGVAISALGKGAGTPLAKQPLIVRLDHVDPWAGSVIVCGSSDLFRDDTFVIETLAHKRLAESIVATLASDDRLVLARASALRAAPLPALPGGQRMFWRVIAVFLFPLLLIVFAVVRARRVGGSAAGLPVGLPAGRRLRESQVMSVAGRVAVGLLVVGVVVGLTRGAARIDVTDGGLNQLAPYTASLARSAVDEHRVTAELIASGNDRLPPEMRADVGRLLGALEELRQAGAEIDLQRTWPEDLDAAGRVTLAGQGVVPVKVTSESDEVKTVREVYCALRLRAGGTEELLSFTGRDAFEHLEFRLAFALWRLQTGKRPRLAFASDVPRLSAAESFTHYQQQGLIPPSGKDVYGLARRVLEAVDFRVTHVTPRTPELPDDIDALLWIQPRRTVTPMLDKVVDYLYRGGKVLVAAQHFVVQSRQYRGAKEAFEFDYWPQPQSPDIEEFYYPDLGVLMKREVLFDASYTRAKLWTILFRSARREFIDMVHAKPFLIRAVAANYADSLFTRGLGDLPFLCGSFFELDAEKLAENGLTATPLIHTSAQSWSLDWKGGWLSHGYLPDPGSPILKADAEAAGMTMTEVDGQERLYPEAFLGAVPLAVLVEGQFPWPEREFQQMAITFGPDGQQEAPALPPPYAAEEPVDRAAPGRLLLVGDSEMWKDGPLTDLRSMFRADHFLLNVAAALALPDELAEIMTRRSVHKGFGKIEPDARIKWRAIVLGTLPLLMGFMFVMRAVTARVGAVFVVGAGGTR